MGACDEFDWVGFPLYRSRVSWPQCVSATVEGGQRSSFRARSVAVKSLALPPCAGTFLSVGGQER